MDAFLFWGSTYPNICPMSESICKFIPAKDYVDDLKTVHFVYETEHNSWNYPVCSASGVLHISG